jgi:CxxC motif-containing protein (DUF1111 family)
MHRVSAEFLCAVGLSIAASSAALAQARGEVRDPGARAGMAAAGEPVFGVEPQYFANLRSAFQEVHSVAGDIEPGSGLGPRFNGISCGGCHAYPAAGGSSPPRNPQFAMAKAHHARNSIPEFVKPDGPVRAVRLKSRAGWIQAGEVAPLFTITGRSDARKCALGQPDFSNTGNLSFRIPTPTFGAGLIENISDAVILGNRDSQARAKRELGISGRPNVAADGAIGRFGWKAQHSSLIRFAGKRTKLRWACPTMFPHTSGNHSPKPVIPFMEILTTIPPITPSPTVRAWWRRFSCLPSSCVS